jgi:hypothetical protein
MGRFVVEAQPELASDDLAGEARTRPQAGALRLRLHGLGDIAHPELLDKQLVEARDRDVGAPDAHGRDAEVRAERRERVVELGGLEALRAAEPAARQRRQHAGLAHHPLRDRVPAAQAAHRALRRQGAEQDRGDGDQPVTRHARQPRSNRETNTTRR